MAVCLNGMEGAETRALTEAMLRSGTILDLCHIPGEKVDKHSTGGVGNKTSLIIAPLAAAAGVKVPMISGRALGHSGGTLDKLESIPGFDVRLDDARFQEVVASVGCAIVGQTDSIAPADRKLYALRDVTATIESLPLITASILSKKLAEGISGLVLDVKVGNGAFMKTIEDARAMAGLLLETSADMGKNAVALLTDMNQPLGNEIGNALEVKESIDVLEGRGPEDLTELCMTLTAHMLVFGGVVADVDAGGAKARELLASGAGLEKFHALVEAQGGDLSDLPKAQHTKTLTTDVAGIVSGIETESIGRASMLLGAGRQTVDDTIDMAAGITMSAKLGSDVSPGDTLLTFHYSDASKLAEAEPIARAAFTISDATPAKRPSSTRF